jgi:hypothetical protein
MSRKRTGLRNRNRHGVGPYSAYGKAGSRDTYGSYLSGKCLRPDVIAGHMIEAIDQEALKGKKS